MDPTKEILGKHKNRALLCDVTAQQQFSNGTKNCTMLGKMCTKKSIDARQINRSKGGRGSYILFLRGQFPKTKETNSQLKKKGHQEQNQVVVYL